MAGISPVSPIYCGLPFLCPDTTAGSNFSKAKIPPAKDYGGEIWGAGRQTRSIQRYVTSRTNRWGPGFIPVSHSRTAQDHGAEKEGYSENGREHTLYVTERIRRKAPLLMPVSRSRH